MTDQHHPLTDEEAEELELIPPEVMEKPEDYAYYLRGVPVSEAIRLAKDWQLEQVIAHLRHNLHFTPTSVDYIVQNLREAMRPTTQEDN